MMDMKTIYLLTCTDLEELTNGTCGLEIFDDQNDQLEGVARLVDLTAALRLAKLRADRSNMTWRVLKVEVLTEFEGKLVNGVGVVKHQG